MAESSDIRSSDSVASEILQENVCYYCKEDGKQLKACGFCLDCGDHLCEECFQNHRKTRLTKYHVVMTLDQILAENGAVFPKDTCTDVCPKHTDEIIKYYCDLHDVFGCTVCMTVVHRNCEGVEYIPDVSEGLPESTDVQELISDLDILVSKSENVIKESKENVSLAAATYTQATEAAEKCCENIIARVKSLLKNTMEKAGALRDADIKSMDATSRAAETTLEKMKASSSELDTLRKTHQGCKLFVAMQNVSREMASASETIDELVQTNTVDSYSFQPCHEITSVMAGNESDGLGSLSSLPLSLKQEPEPKVKHGNLHLGNEFASCERKTSDKQTATRVTEIQLYSKGESARNCGFNVFVFLSPNRLLVLDKSNNKIKFVDTQKGKLVGKFLLEGNPEKLLQVSATQVAVVYHDSDWKTMEVFRIAGTDLILERQFSFHTDSSPSVFKYVAEQNCFIAIGNNYAQKIGMFGSMSSPLQLGTIDGKQSHVMNEISADNQSVYVKTFDEYRYGSYKNASIRKIDFDGKGSSSDQLSLKDESSDIKYLSDQAIGMFILTQKSIYMTPGLSQESTLLLSETDGIYKPYYVHHCPTTNKLYVGLEGCKFLKVFQL